MEYTIEDFKAGQTVQLHPATDLWMRGLRFGLVKAVTKRFVMVHICFMGKRLQTFRTLRVLPSQIVEIL
jgi:hypothetical protein